MTTQILPDVLRGTSLTLERLGPQHRDDLRVACHGDDDIWTFFPETFNGAGEFFDAWFDHTLAQSRVGAQHAFAVRLHADGRVVGTTRYYDISLVHHRLAIGSTWYERKYRGTLVNSEVRLLTLEYAFEHLGVNRVELITDPRNITSRAAMRILGATQEGVLRQHLVYRDGRIRDSIVFSIISSEWPTVRERLIERLDHGSGTPDGVAGA